MPDCHAVIKLLHTADGAGSSSGPKCSARRAHNSRIKTKMRIGQKMAWTIGWRSSVRRRLNRSEPPCRDPESSVLDSAVAQLPVVRVAPVVFIFVSIRAAIPVIMKPRSLFASGRRRKRDQSIAFFHPDSTVGPGLTPDHAQLRSRAMTADRELTAPGRLTLPRRQTYSVLASF